jgi:hypothetical protein
MYKYAFTKKVWLELTIENFMPITPPVMDTLELSQKMHQENVQASDFNRILGWSDS